MSKTTMILATFEDRARLRAGLDALFEQHVAPDDVGVMVSGPDGRERKRLRFRTGLLRGASVGAGLGGFLGATTALLITAGALVVPEADILAANPWLAMLEGALAGAGMGGLLGAVSGLGRWRTGVAMRADALEHEDRAVVGVTADPARADWLEQVLSDAGAKRVTTCEPVDAPRPILRAIVAR